MKIPIPDDWNGEDCCRWTVYWPDSPKWLAILHGLLEMPAQGRFWDFGTGHFLTLREQFRPFYDRNFTLEDTIMACNDSSIADAIQAVAFAIASQQAGGSASATASAACGGGGGLVENTTYCFGGNDVNVISYVSISGNDSFPVFGTQQTPPLPPSGYPSGYSDLAEYDADKCAKATKLVDDWIASVRSFGRTQWGIGVVGAVAILACLVGLITVPPAVIPLLLFALTANQTVTALLIQLAAQMEDARQDLICILFEGENVNTIISLLADALDALISLIPGGSAAQIFLKEVALWLMNEDTLGILFTASAKSQFPEADCSGCVTQHWMFCHNQQTQLLEFDVPAIAGCGISNSGCYAIYVAFDNTGGNYPSGGQQYYVEVANPPSAGPCSTSGGVPYKRYYYLNNDGNSLLSTNTPNESLACNGIQVIGGTTPFTVTLTLTPV